MNSQLAVLSERECWDLLDSAVVGIVGFVDADGQQLIPVNIQVIEQRLYFRIDETTSLGILADGHDDVAVAASHADSLFGHGWNVTVHGSSGQVDDDAIRDALEHSGRRSAWAGGDRNTIVEVQPRSIAGRRVHHR